MSFNNNQKINNINDKVANLIERISKLENSNVAQFDTLKQVLLDINENINNLSNKSAAGSSGVNNVSEEMKGLFVNVMKDLINFDQSKLKSYNVSDEIKGLFVKVMQELKYDPVKLRHIVKSIYDMDLIEFKEYIKSPQNFLKNEDNVIYDICDKLFDQNKPDFIFEVLKVFQLEFENNDKNTNLLMKVVASNDVELAQMIIDRSCYGSIDDGEYHPVIELLDDHNETCLSYLNFNKDYIDMLNILLDAGVDVNNVNKDGYSVLMYAVESDRKYMAELLLEKMSKDAINYQDEFGNTALHYAFIHKNSFMVDLLLKNGANYKLKNNENKKPSQLVSRDSDCYKIAYEHVSKIVIKEHLM